MTRWLCALVAVVPLAAGRGAEPPGSPTPNVAATVNGEVIRLDQVDAVVRRTAPADGPLTEAQARRLRQEVVQDLIDDALLRQFLRDHGPAVEPAELEKHFRALAVSLQRKGKTLADFYRETGQTEAQVRDTWATLFRFQKYVDQHAPEAELRKFYDANKDFFDGTMVRVSHVVVRVSPNGPPGERVAARQKLAGVRAEIVAGKLTFADAARKYSMCPTAPKGGDLGLIGRRDTLVEESFAKTAFALKVGEVSEPTDTDYGVHLIQVTERKPGAGSTFEKVADLVRECYGEDLRRGLVAQLRKQARIQVAVP